MFAKTRLLETCCHSRVRKLDSS